MGVLMNLKKKTGQREGGGLQPFNPNPGSTSAVLGHWTTDSYISHRDLVSVETLTSTASGGCEALHFYICNWAFIKSGLQIGHCNCNVHSKADVWSLRPSSSGGWPKLGELRSSWAKKIFLTNLLCTTILTAKISKHNYILNCLPAHRVSKRFFQYFFCMLVSLTQESHSIFVR